VLSARAVGSAAPAPQVPSRRSEVKMQTLTVGASSLEVARGLYSALAEFSPEMAEKDDGGYSVTVSLRGGDRQIVAILSALEQHVSERNDGPARLELEGRTYVLHGDG
jgi:ABC-type sulfate transport system substrate-binding protein